MPDQPPVKIEATSGRAPRLRLTSARSIAGAALGGAAIALATQFALAHHAGVPAVGVGFLVAAVLFGLAARASAGDAATADAPMRGVPLAGEIALGVAVGALALFFRTYRFGDFPPGLWYDEAVNGVEALTILHNHTIVLWSESNDGRATLFLYLLAGAIKLFGTSEAALRVVPVAAGMGAVVAFYFLARRLLTREAALAAAALFAVSRWAVTFSRIAWEASLVPVIEITSVYLLLRALETRSRVCFALGGVTLAAGLYTYVAFRMVPVVVPFMLAYVALRERDLLRRNAAGLAVFAAAFVLAAAPIGAYALAHPDRVLARTRKVSVTSEITDRGSVRPLWDNAVSSLKMMNAAGDRNGRSNLPGEPMLDAVTAALLVLGAAASALALREWRRGMLLGWLVLALVPGALTITAGNPSGIRGLGALAPLFLLAGVAVETLQRALLPFARGRLIFAALVLAAVGGAAAINYDTLFGRQAHDRRVYDAFDPLYGHAAEFVARQDASKHVYLSSGLAAHPAVGVLADGARYSIYDDGRTRFERDGRDVVVVLGDEATAANVMGTFANTYRTNQRDPFGRQEFIVLKIGAADIAARTGGEPPALEQP
jgi:4-amino-4-deoxy-L-arabinose transferase-like glycosyltransferase